MGEATEYRAMVDAVREVAADNSWRVDTATMKHDFKKGEDVLTVKLFAADGQQTLDLPEGGGEAGGEPASGPARRGE